MVVVLTSFKSGQSYSSGATVLGNESGQRFNNVDKITDIDDSNMTTIYLRLVIGNSEPYLSLKNMNNGYSTSIPPRIDNPYLFI